MKARLVTYSVVAAVVPGILLLVSMSTAGNQGGQSAAKPEPKCIGCSVDGKTPRMPDGRPDLNGFWGGSAEGGDFDSYTEDGSSGGHLGVRSADGSVYFDFGGPNASQFAPPLAANQAPYNPEWAAKVKAIADVRWGGTTDMDPMMHCKPLGVPRGSFGTMQIVQHPQQIAILYESAPGPVYRIIYTDGRTHPDDLDPSYMGHSIGHWEGDTLVVDVAGLNDETWLAGDVRGVWNLTSIHSDQMHVIERWTRNGDMLRYEATVTDPVAFTKPWVVTRSIRHAGQYDPGVRLIEYYCEKRTVDHVRPQTEDNKFICNYPGQRPECQQK